MIRFKDISIPKPCSVEYDSLPGDEVKRFCGSCEKHVYDFRGKDEAYFNSIIDTHGKVCGFFYADEIQTTSKNKYSFYHAIFAKTIGAMLFIKTLLSSDYTQASNIQTYTTQQATDSTGIKIKIKNKYNYYTSYSIDIFINNVLYKSGYNLGTDSDYIWLPDSLNKNDKIKVFIHHSKRKSGGYIFKTKKRAYIFPYKDSNKIVITITSKRKAILIKKRKRRQYGGYMDY